MAKDGSLRRTVVFTAGLLVLFASTSARAQEADEQTRNAAREHFTAGRTAFTAEDFGTALGEFRAANDILPSSLALSYVGQCLQRLERPTEALGVFRQFVELYGGSTNDRDRQELEKVRGWIDALEETIGTVRVEVAVSGATVLVDGAIVGTAPLSQPVSLVQGSHVFRAEADGYRPAEETVVVAAGQTATVTLVPAQERTTAQVDLSANVPGAVARLDGEILGALPFRGDVAPGVHQLEISAEGYETARVAITLQAGQPFNRSFDLSPAVVEDEEHWYEKWWVWTIAGVVIGGATAGIVLGTVGGDTVPDSSWNLALP
jgi:hypothetical protein